MQGLRIKGAGCQHDGGNAAALQLNQVVATPRRARPSVG
jgi:hypothetical protein